MAYNVISGQILLNRLYVIAGTQSVTYNSITYSTGQTFRGVSGIFTFTYSGTGTQSLNEVQEQLGSVIEFVETAASNPIFPETTLLLGMAIEFSLTDAEKVTNEVTNIKGFSIELIDYPFYSFEITETRL